MQNMFKYHHRPDNSMIAELLPGETVISNTDEILNLMAEAGMNGCSKMVIHSASLHGDFFNLKTGLAGEILQKFSNYRMKLSIVGDFSKVSSKSLKDFIRESNRTGIITFTGNIGEALR